MAAVAGITNKGKKKLLDWSLRQATMETNLYFALCTDTATPTVDTNTLSQLEEIGAGNGYTSGGYQITPNSTDVDTCTEDDTNDLGYIKFKDISWTASGGVVPASGDGISYIVLTDDNGTVDDREVYAYWDVEDSSTPRTLADGETITFADIEMQLGDP